MLSGFSAPKFHSTECGDEQGNNIQVRLGENAAGVSLACPSAAPPPAPVSIHNATFTATHCILLSLPSNESFVNSLNKQPGKEYNYSECQVGSQNIKKKKKKKKTQTSTLIWCFFDDPRDVCNLISGSSAFSKSSLNIWLGYLEII